MDNNETKRSKTAKSVWESVRVNEERRRLKKDRQEADLRRQRAKSEAKQFAAKASISATIHEIGRALEDLWSNTIEYGGRRDSLRARPDIQWKNCSASGSPDATSVSVELGRVVAPVFCVTVCRRNDGHPFAKWDLAARSFPLKRITAAVEEEDPEPRIAISTTELAGGWEANEVSDPWWTTGFPLPHSRSLDEIGGPPDYSFASRSGLSWRPLPTGDFHRDLSNYQFAVMELDLKLSISDWLRHQKIYDSRRLSDKFSYTKKTTRRAKSGLAATKILFREIARYLDEQPDSGQELVDSQLARYLNSVALALEGLNERSLDEHRSLLCNAEQMVPAVRPIWWERIIRQKNAGSLASRPEDLSGKEAPSVNGDMRARAQAIASYKDVYQVDFVAPATVRVALVNDRSTQSRTIREYCERQRLSCVFIKPVDCLWEGPLKEEPRRHDPSLGSNNPKRLNQILQEARSTQDEHRLEQLANAAEFEGYFRLAECIRRRTLDKL